MRSSISIPILSLLLPTLAASTATSECLRSKAVSLAIESLCGDKETMVRCFKQASDADIVTLESCLKNAGCTPKAAASEASYLVTFCNGEPSDLKRREREGLAARATDSTASADSTTTTDASTTATTTGTSAVSKRETTDTTATATTTAATTAATTDTTATGSTTVFSGTACSSAKATAVSSCDSKNQYDCSIVTTTTLVCRSNYYCDTDASGNNLCMVRQDGMTLSGTIVAIFLAIGMTGIIASVIFLCCQDRKEQKRQRARTEAAAIAKANSVSRPETRSASQPVRSISQSDAAHQPNPFAG
ncbi:hypothetical protein BKA67DRAFT_541168 [Truncatella angustata]|uniref:Uncharacterized protein n=1 Tax=Truncatella angustata TaxID=152316 RepID=A0A9P8RHM8_9PEZI|nr:uncharacterized protein BKA67DRAFT_541168 [Truncatella angustata]KAH6646188.1 hypothetical protein BKA67DRAFT_541168 [Truncatella angustata]KAH8196994.1 hypothetical protein TruAng_008853 [Truncatella angustata]